MPKSAGMQVSRDYSFFSTKPPFGRVIESQSSQSYDQWMEPGYVNQFTGLPGPVENEGAQTQQCGWNVDDLFDKQAAGNLAQGEEFEFSIPWIFDNQQHLIALDCNARNGRTFTLELECETIGFRYSHSYSGKGRLVLFGPQFDLAPLQEILDSNGGRGIIGAYECRLTCTDRRGLGSASFAATMYYPNGGGFSIATGNPSTNPSDYLTHPLQNGFYLVKE